MSLCISRDMVVKEGKGGSGLRDIPCELEVLRRTNCPARRRDGREYTWGTGGWEQGREVKGGKGEKRRTTGILPYKCAKTWVNGHLIKSKCRIN